MRSWWRRICATGSMFMHAAHLYINELDVQQGVWNLRDQNKGDFRMLVLLGPGNLQMQSLLKSDVMVFNQPLPTEQAEPKGRGKTA